MSPVSQLTVVSQLVTATVDTATDREEDLSQCLRRANFHVDWCHCRRDVCPRTRRNTHLQQM